MLRVWGLALGLMVACLLVFLGVGFFGEQTLKFVGVIVGGAAAAAYLPGGVSIGRAIFLVLGVVASAIGFVLGSVAFPDDDKGILFGALVPILLSAIATFWTRQPAAFLTMLIGAGALGAVYTESFFVDPFGINYALPIAMGEALVPLALGYLVAALVTSLWPDRERTPKDAENVIGPSPAALAAEPVDTTAGSAS